jgi:hypothetical protein
MIEQQFHRGLPTQFDINGPILSFTQIPSGISGNVGSTIQLTGVAIATFPNNTATPTGSIAYRWYEVGKGALSDGNRLSGTNTNTLTITNLQSPSDNGRQFYLEARYIPSGYIPGKTARGLNEPIYSNVVGAGVQLPAAPSASLSASSTSVAYGGSVTLTWNTSGATRLTSNFGRSDLNGSITISNLTNSVTYEIVASNQGGSTRRTVTIGVASPPAPPPPPPSGPAAPSVSLLGITIIPSGSGFGGTVPYNQGITMSLNIFGADTVTSNFGYSESNLGQGTISRTLSVNNITINPTTFTVSATGPGGTRTASLRVNVGPNIRITSQPLDSNVNEGAFATFNVESSIDNSTSATLQYQWYVNGSPVSNSTGSVGGANTKTLTISRPAGNYTVFCRLSYSGASSVDTRSANYIVNRVVVNPTISITQQPTSQTVSTNQTATFNVRGVASDGSAVSYQWFNAATGVALSNTSTVSGATTPTISVVSSIPVSEGSQQIFARVFHPTASNSPVQSNTVTYTAVAPREIINYEVANDGGGLIGTGTHNLASNSISFNADPGNPTRSLIIYPTEKDIRVRITMAAGAGQSRNGNSGGQGGLSTFDFTLRQNTEYVFKLGSFSQPTGGANGGGGAAFLYEKGRLIAVCGGGGAAGTASRGGSGGGVGVNGESGQGRGGGSTRSGSLSSSSGSFANGVLGGQVSSCTIGEYYRQIGFSPCQDVGLQQWRSLSGAITSGTATIQRGYKAGLGYRNNGGDGSGNEGGGGSGAFGGNAATSDGSGGAGGSGFNGGVATISTQLSGNSSTNAYVTLRLA